MKKKLLCILLVIFCVIPLASCTKSNEQIKIGVSFGTGSSKRWALEKQYMEDYAKKAGVDIEVRLTDINEKRKQSEDCRELIDRNIDVLILRPKELDGLSEIVDYAHDKGVKVISYAGLLKDTKIDLFIGYDCENIGEKMAKYATEIVYQGDYIILSGDKDDTIVSDYMYKGIMSELKPFIKSNEINVLLDENVKEWNPENAKGMVREAIIKNGNKVDVILAPNDGIAGACAEVLKELGITQNVIITGMDAQIDAAQRIIAGTQSSTIYMNLKNMAEIAVDEAIIFAKKGENKVNGSFDNGKNIKVPVHLITGELVIKQNLDKILIDSGYLSKEDVYGSS